MSGVVTRARGFEILRASSVAASVTGTTTQTALATVTIPGGAMGPNGIIRIQTLWTVTNSVNTKTLQTFFNGVAGTVYQFVQVTTAATITDQRVIGNVNSLSSQKGKTTGGMSGGAGWGTASGAATTSTVNTANAVDIVFTGTLANTGETITLEQYIVEILRG